MFGLPHCFVITTESDEGVRRISAASQLDALAARFTFIRGYTPDDPEIDLRYSGSLNYTSMKRPLSRGEIAAYLSHRRALSAFLETDADCGIILEDDFGMIDRDRFSEQVSKLLQATVKWDIIKLFDYRQRKNARALVDLGTIQLVEHLKPTSGMVGYLVRRSGAKKLTERRFVFRPIDEDLKFYWELDLHAYSVIPNLLSEISDRLGGSQIEPERALLRSNRSLLRAMRGLYIEIKRKSMHYRNRQRYGLKAAMQNYEPGPIK